MKTKNMKEKIVTRVEWKDEYLIGNDFLDAQHIKLFEMSNDFFDAVQAGDGSETKAVAVVLSKLIDYAEQHFREEEQFFESIGAEKIDEHKAYHAMLSKMIRTLYDEILMGRCSEVAPKVEKWLKSYLLPHVLESDRGNVKVYNET